MTESSELRGEGMTETLRLLEPRRDFGLMPGKVVQDTGVTPGDGYLRVRVDAWYGPATADEFIPDDMLPWAKPMFPVAGDQDGEAWVPEVGSFVWVLALEGDRERPVWLGGWRPDAQIPPEFASSYSPGPKTRLIKAGGNTFEMRWKAGQEHVYIKTAGGALLDMVDSPALGGPKIVAQLPSGRAMGIDDKLQKAFLQTPTQSVVVDDAGASITATSPSKIQATVAPSSVTLTPLAATVTSPTTTVSGSAAVNINSPAAVTITAGSFALATGIGAFTLPLVLTTAAFTVNAAVLILNSLGLLTLSAVGVLSLLGSSVLIGTLAGSKHFLIDERFYNGPQPYPAHTHDGVTPGAGVSGPVSAATLPSGGLASIATQDTKAS